MCISYVFTESPDERQQPLMDPRFKSLLYDMQSHLTLAYHICLTYASSLDMHAMTLSAHQLYSKSEDNVICLGARIPS